MCNCKFSLWMGLLLYCTFIVIFITGQCIDCGLICSESKEKQRDEKCRQLQPIDILIILLL